MNLFARIKEALPSRLREKTPTNGIQSTETQNTDTIEIYTGENRRVAYKLKQRRRYRTEFGQAELKKAIDQAEDHVHPRRELLYSIYREVVRDLHLFSQMRTANNKVIEQPWAVVKKGTIDIDKERTALLQKKWFEDFRRHCLDTEFWGHSLIQFEQMQPNEDEQTRKLAPAIFNKISLIPRENVEPKKGLLLIWPGDITGIPYRSTLLGDWLLEAGDSENIGLLHACARYSIFKKFGLNDWSRSGEKWGDPLLVIRSSSNDDAENDKKAEFAANFGNNGWAVLDNDDQIDVLERQNDKGYAIFQDLCKYLDEENSKGVNGQTGSSDQKAFVGSAQVHERLLESYTKERLRSEMYYINETLFPFLISKGYDLAGYEYKPLEFMRELVIPGTMPTAPDNNKTEGPEVPEPKKSLSLSQRVEALYHINCTDAHCGHDHQPGYVTLAVGIDPIVQNALRRLHERKVKRGDVDADLVNATTKELWGGIQAGWQQDIQKVPYASTEHLIYLQMRYNTAITSIFKNHTHNLEVIRELFDDQGKLRTWSQFKKAALKISQQYNKDWLQAEYQTAEASARMAKKWQEYSKRGGKLRYMTIGDGRVRDEHRVLDRVTKPVDDPFWNNFYPPLGWRCRCYVRWVDDEEETTDPTELPQVPPAFLGNVGKSGEIFNGEHPYFDQAGSLKPNRIKLPVSPERMRENTTLFRQYTMNQNYKLIATDNQNGGFVFAHAKADVADLAQNRTVGKALASEGYAVAIREHLQLSGVSNPELELTGKLSDLKVPTSDNPVSAMENSFKKASMQGIDNFVLYLKKDYDLTRLENGLRSGFRNRSKINKVIIVKGSKVVEVSRTDYADGHIINRLKEL